MFAIDVQLDLISVPITIGVIVVIANLIFVVIFVEITVLIVALVIGLSFDLIVHVVTAVITVDMYGDAVVKFATVIVVIVSSSIERSGPRQCPTTLAELQSLISP